jgi:hypothetical protein
VEWVNGTKRFEIFEDNNGSHVPQTTLSLFSNPNNMSKTIKSMKTIMAIG